MIHSLRPIFILCSLTFLAFGCGRHEDSTHLKVTNGQETPVQDPAVVLLRFGQGNICTGTFISDKMILTAAHCVQAADGIDVMTVVQKDGKSYEQLQGHSIDTLAHPDYQRADDAHSDLGFIKMPAGSSQSWVPIAARSARVGDFVRLVGFGHNYINQYTDAYVMTEKGAGIKRSGTNTIALVTDGTLRFQGFISPREATDNSQPEGVRVGIGGGDSGGPLFNQQGELVGVVSAQNPSWGAWESIQAMENVFVDLGAPSAQKFLSTLSHW